MTYIERKQISQRLALFERAAVLFERFGPVVPVAIAFLNGWPTEVQLYPEWQLGESWRLFLSANLYWGASYALSRAVSFAQGSIVP
ncbi:hypothetical protein I6F21_23225 [Bradyrhizobium sp. NBAIM03]|uniref:hypothetical protein n=1 Tax=Bradyrhizobium sp. NBAIM03 TaxID=2793816 RepID=UPI001CD6CDFE|nr:hypothetical protein [Bradyrhizobium sp. NBAIM03]MCA1535447.1 hypothetical protein [Bradyrhizobium sp. NBAIM03]